MHAAGAPSVFLSVLCAASSMMLGVWSVLRFFNECTYGFIFHLIQFDTLSLFLVSYDVAT